MAEITLKLRRDPATGKREIVIHLEGEADALPHEHERDHRALVEKLLGRSLTDEDGSIVVERVTKEGQKIGTLDPAPAEAQGTRGTVTNKG
jgi:hypothetical protein